MSKCEDVAKQLYTYIDRELSAEEQTEVRRHLEECPPCQDWFKLEENVLRLVGEHARRLCAPPTLVEKIRRLCAESR